MNWMDWLLGKIADFFVACFAEKFKSSGKKEKGERQDRHIIDVIKNEEREKNFIISKSQIQDFNTKSVLFVMPGEEAAFINNGKIVGILGEGRHVLDTANYPFLSDVISLITGKVRIYSSSIYFIRKAISQPLDWGMSIQIRDPVQLICTRLMCNGVYRIQIKDSSNFLEQFIGNGLDKLNFIELSQLLKDDILRTVRAYLSDYLVTRDEEILGISSKQNELSEMLGRRIANMFIQYGIEISSFSIVGINILDGQTNREEIERAYRDKRIDEIKSSV